MSAQPSLFDTADELTVSSLSNRCEYRMLGDGAWLDLHPGWVHGSHELFETLLTELPWLAERRRMYDRTLDVPRLACFLTSDEPLPHPILTVMMHSLNEHYSPDEGGPVQTVGFCLYRNGADSVAWHGDRFGRHDRTMVAIVSLGESRPFLLRPRGGGTSLKMTLASGDLLVMGGTCQATWDHAIPKVARPLGPRVSVQFRPAGVR